MGRGQKHIRATTDARPLELAYAYWNTGKPANLLDYIEHRGKWPSKGQRYCTSGLKRGPIQREIRRICAVSGMMPNRLQSIAWV